MQPLVTAAQLDAVLRAPVALVFKHSTRCPVSSMAYAEVRRLLDERPEAPVWIVDVIVQRALSREVAARTGVEHESPQVILLAGGEVLYDASHFEVRADELARELDAAEGAAEHR
jgi:bacillithiol system protein YtxJ